MSGSSESELLFTLRMRDEASAALKQVQGSIQQLAAQVQASGNVHKASTAAITAHTAATKTSSVSLLEASYAARLLGAAHTELASTLQHGSQFLGKFGAVLGEIGPTGLVVAGALGVIAAETVHAITAAADYDYQSVKLSATLRSIGESGKISFKELEDAAKQVSGKTLFSDEEMVAGGVQLSRILGLTKEQIVGLLPDLANFAAYTGSSIPAAAQQMTRMLQNPIQGMMFLSRVTRDVSAADRERVKSAMESGNLDQARTILLDNLRRKDKDYAEEMKGGLSGAYQALRKEVVDTSEEGTRALGRWVSETLRLETVFRALAKAIRDAKDANDAAAKADTPIGRAQQQLTEAQERLRQAQNPQALSGFQTPGLAALFPGLYRQSQEARRTEAVTAAQRDIDTARERVQMEEMFTPAGPPGTGMSSQQIKIIEDNTKKYLETLNPLIAQTDKYNNAISNLTQQTLIDQVALEKDIAEMNRRAAAGENVDDFTAKIDADTKALLEHQKALEGARITLLNLSDTVGTLTLKNQDEARRAGMTPGGQDFQKRLEEAAKAVAPTRGIDPTKGDAWRTLQTDPIVQQIAATAQSQVAASALTLSQQTFKAEWPLIQAAMQQGVAGQQAQAELEAQRAVTKQYPSAPGQGPISPAQYTPEMQKVHDESLMQAVKTFQAKNTEENNRAYEDMQFQNKLLQEQIDMQRGAPMPVAAGTTAHSDPLSGTPWEYAQSRIIARESGGRNISNQQGPGGTPLSSASGFYQITDATWHDTARKAGIDITNYATAMSAPKELQDQIAKALYSFRGVQPWAASAPRTDTRTDTRAGITSGTRTDTTPGALLPGMTTYNALADIKDVIEAEKEAHKRAQTSGLSYAEELAKLLPIVRQRSESERVISLNDQKYAIAQQDAITRAGFTGGPQALAQEKALQEGASKGYKGTALVDFTQTQAAQARSDFAASAQTATQKLSDDTAVKNLEALIAATSDENTTIQTQIMLLHQQADAAGESWDSEPVRRQTEAIKENAAAAERLRQASGPVSQYIKSANDDMMNFQSLGVSAIDQVGSAFGAVVSGATTAQQAVQRLTQSLAAMAAEAAFKSIMGKVFNTILGGTGGGLTGAGESSLLGVSESSLLGPLGSGLLSSGLGFAKGGIMTSRGPMPLTSYAEGGVMTPEGPAPLRKYVSGGVAYTPQMAMFGEGSTPEAYVPLPDGKSIPVVMKGGSGGGANIQNNFNVTVNAGSSGGGAPTPGGNSSQMNPQQMGNTIAAAMRNMVVEVMHDQLRVGGALNPSMRNG